jgi:pimeloyl-ACP methyl ester carboxylesterase
MFFYIFFSFWELLFRLIGSCIMSMLWVTRLMFLISIPIIVLLVSTLIVAKIAFKLTTVKSDENRSVQEIVTSRGFRFQDHTIKTTDGYLLRMFRVMNPYIPDQERVRKPVLLMHGLGTHALIFLLNDEHGPEYKRLLDPNDPLYKFAASKSKKNKDDDGLEEIITSDNYDDALGFDLASRGYDVWLGNQRGNRFSTKHAFLDKDRDSSKFWDYSLDEVAMFDLPAMIDHVLKETGQETLSYVGLSQGAVMMFALLSTQQRYNDVIRPFIAIAPACRTKHSQLINGFGNTVIKWLPTFALWFPGRAYPAFLEFLIQLFFCNHSLEAFSNVVGQLFYAGKYVNQKRISAFLAFPGIHCSRKNVAHYFQLRDREFGHFDHGSKGNVKRYGTNEAPAYRLDRITCQHIAFIYSSDDTMAAASDIRFLRSKLVVEPMDVYVIRKKKWDHNDFLLGKDSGVIVNKRIHILIKAANDCPEFMSALPSLSSGYLTPNAGPSSLRSDAGNKQHKRNEDRKGHQEAGDEAFHSFPSPVDSVMRHGHDDRSRSSSNSTGSQSSSPSSSFEVIPAFGSASLDDDDGHEESRRPPVDDLLKQGPTVRRRRR